MGSFFKRFEKKLQKAGARTWKVCLNGGDWVYSNNGSRLLFTGRPEEWPLFIQNILHTLDIDVLFLFGDCRYYQAEALRAARKMDILGFVFEEGYLRPDCVTLEAGGVNDYSSIPRDPEFYRGLRPGDFHPKEMLPAYPSAGKAAWESTVYYVAMALMRGFFPHYRHHRETAVFREAGIGIRTFLRRYLYRIREKDVLDELTGVLRKKYFFLPLQTYGDFQLRDHSCFASIPECTEKVLRSFAAHAPQECHLVIKHHPVDRGRFDYTGEIMALARELGVEERIRVFHDVHLPTCLKNARGTVTINSTVGLSSLYHHIPTKVLGLALYDIEGLTAKNTSLEEFWVHPPIPDGKLFTRFRSYLLEHTQLNGSFTGRFPVELDAWLDKE